MSSLPVINQPAERSAALLYNLTRRMQLGSEAVLAPLHVRPRHLVALTVLRDLDGVGQQALAAHLQIDGTNLVGLLNELETAGLVERHRVAEDRRRHIVQLTDAGREQLAKAEFALAAVEQDVLRGLNQEERTQLFSLLKRAVLAHPLHQPDLGMPGRGEPCISDDGHPEPC